MSVIFGGAKGLAPPLWIDPALRAPSDAGATARDGVRSPRWKVKGRTPTGARLLGGLSLRNRNGPCAEVSPIETAAGLVFRTDGAILGSRMAWPARRMARTCDKTASRLRPGSSLAQPDAESLFLFQRTSRCARSSSFQSTCSSQCKKSRQAGGTDRAKRDGPRGNSRCEICVRRSGQKRSIHCWMHRKTLAHTGRPTRPPREDD